jgi:hypothetical protein
MPAFIDITGNKYARLTVLSRAENKGKRIRWNCVCDCGKTAVVCSYYLKSGRTKSCGCYQREMTSSRFKVHGKNKETKYRKDIRLKYKYGISMETYNEMFENQNGLCKICNYKFGQKAADCYVDHDHKTLVVRGLLCQQCNTGLGNFKDNHQFLLNAIEYLEASHVHAE